MTATTTKTAKAPAKDKPSNLFRVLPVAGIFLVNSTEFAKQAATSQTKLLASTAHAVRFVTNFADLSNRRLIRDALLSGKNVSLELEFNGLELSEDEVAALKAVSPVLKKIDAIGPVYPWLPAQNFPEIIFNAGGVIRNGYSITETVAKAIWRRTSRYWGGGNKPGDTYQTSGIGGYSKTIQYRSDSISIGCQTISRAEVEFIARYYGWDPVVS
jgi:hypothetical protein